MSRRTGQSDERRLERGFTLIEVLIGMVMTLAIFLAAMPIIEGAANTQGRAQTTGFAIGDAREFEELVLADLRPASKFSLSSSLVPPTSGNSITVTTLVHNTFCGSQTLDDRSLGSSTKDVISCRVKYVCNSGTCTRQELNPDGTGSGLPITVITGISNSASVFTPSYSGDGGLTGGGVRYVAVEVVLPNKSSQGDDAITLDDGVALRNMQ
jgi:prepilin-type N-terminal cleavage/methylation domain-containing protein